MTDMGVWFFLTANNQKSFKYPRKNREKKPNDVREEKMALLILEDLIINLEEVTSITPLLEAIPPP